MQFPDPLPSCGQNQHWNQLFGASKALCIANLSEQLRTPLLIVTPDQTTTLDLMDPLPFFLKSATSILHFPDYEILPYDQFSPNEAILSERTRILSRLSQIKSSIIFVTVSTLMQRLSPPDHISHSTFSLQVGDVLDPQAMRNQLTNNGYHLVSQVVSPGEFAIRGALIDLFPMGTKQPYRIDLFDDEIDSIRLFDPETQLSSGKIDRIDLMPAKEFPTDQNAINTFRNHWREHFSGNPQLASMYQDVTQGIFPQGIENYLPLFFDQTVTLFDYLPENTHCIFIEDVMQSATHFWDDIHSRYEQYRHDITKPLLAPNQLFLRPDELGQYYHQYPQLYLTETKPRSTQHVTNFHIKQIGNVSINHHLQNPLSSFGSYLRKAQKQHERVLLCVETPGRPEILIDLLQSANLTPSVVHSWHDFYHDPKITFGITIASILNSFTLIDEQITVIADAQLTQHITVREKKRHERVADPDSIIRNLTELNIGDPVVHIEHGVGRYAGLETISLDNIDNEFVTLIYANEAKLYVPVTSLHLINRYNGVDADVAPLNKLGSEHWLKAKRKAAEKIRDVAAELLIIYAKREASPGFCFNRQPELYPQFASQFPFDETPDQQHAIDATLDDMCSNKVMDRLICGDVGFGKTEVAMRAAFIAVNSGKQVCVLVPTTLLAQQHYQNFCDRFANWPIQIGVLSRFNSQKEQTNTLNALKNGKVDIIIGTHKLIQRNIQFHDVGLFIVDEEHRFGVRQKDHLKSLRANVDMLALTATPIPRTLNMAMTNIRDLSIIATPPAKRLSIKTFVRSYNKTIILEAIQREMLRGGQIYYIFNNVEKINGIADQLRNLIPEANIAVAHGQMPERQLENIMSAFYHHQYHVLVCTTIIETGIDIPTANTIIIDKADHFGLAQLHQLRGRVGRSHHQAYAYLLTRGDKAVTKEAEKRLNAIASLEDLGAGFMLATHDLEIRGAGELLGDEQSGQIQAIGFSLYTEILEKAVEALKAGKLFDIDQIDSQQCDIHIKVPALIPEDYLPDLNSRLIFYKRIANAKTKEELDQLQIEMIDRFGLMPNHLKNLFAITYIKLIGQTLKIKKLDATVKTVLIEFSDDPTIDQKALLKLIQLQPSKYQLTPKQQLHCTFQSNSEDDKNLPASELLQQLTKLLNGLKKHQG